MSDTYFCFDFLRLMLSVSLNCPFCVAPSIIAIVYFDELCVNQSGIFSLDISRISNIAEENIHVKIIRNGITGQGLKHV